MLLSLLLSLSVCLSVCLTLSLSVFRSVSLCLQEEDVDTNVGFLQTPDTGALQKKPGGRKLWLGVALLLGSAALALITGLLVWHFHRRSLSSSSRISAEPLVSQ